MKKRFFAAALAAGIVLGATGCAQMNREQHTGCTVEDKDRTTTSDGSSSQRVYTSCGVFEVADDLIEGQWNSADLYSSIEIGAAYDLETIGWRNGFLSIFPNITKAEATA